MYYIMCRFIYVLLNILQERLKNVNINITRVLIKVGSSLDS